jgi:glycosyltransferase involved in cell wall biosynthesis
MAKVSTLIPSYNAAKYLPVAIKSVINQTYDDWEIVIIDDGSTDNTRAVVEPYGRALGGKLQYVYQSNRGLPAARNSGIRHARGELIALLDADDSWLPARLARGVEVMNADKNIGLVHSKVARIDVDGNVVRYPIYPSKYLSGRIARHIYTRRAHISCPSVLFRKACLDSVGMFDEAMATTEDRDLWFRIAERFEIAYIDEVLANWRVTPGSMSSNLNKMRDGQIAFAHKHYEKGACTQAELHEALAEIHREQGDAFFSGGEVARSIKLYFRSVLYNPRRARNLYMLLRACAEPLLHFA